MTVGLPGLKAARLAAGVVSRRRLRGRFLLALPLAGWRREGSDARDLGAVVVGLALYVIPVGGLILSYLSTTMRYQTDYSVGLAVLALPAQQASDVMPPASGIGPGQGVPGSR